jgi:hypothetical protein
MFFDGSVAAPPTMTVFAFSPDISLFVIFLS